MSERGKLYAVIDEKIMRADAVGTAIPLWGVLLGIFFIGRAIESLLMRSSHSLSVSIELYELLGLMHDARAALLLGGVLAAMYAVVFPFSREAAFWMFVGATVVLGTLQLGLAYYFSLTLQPLGRELWGYSPMEIVDTVQASGKIGAEVVAVALALVGTVVGLCLIARRRRAPAWVGYAGSGLLVVSLTFGLPDAGNKRPATQFLSTNKTMHLLTESIASLFASSASGGMTVSLGGSSYDTALQDTVSRTYPWMYRANYNDVLGPFFESPDTTTAGRQLPNIVFIVFEGLGTAFVGEENAYGGFTPFVDSLSQESLYWPNTLSTTGRTFGLMPSLFGSLPYAEQGFMEMGADMPRHRTLIGVLGERGYWTSYYSGFDLSFDNVGRFLERQGIDRATGRGALRRLFGDSERTKRYWGYPDKALFGRAARIMDTVDHRPRLSIIHTLQTHDPFVVPDEAQYDRRFEHRLDEVAASGEEKARYRTYRDELTTFLYTDDALRQFFRGYRTHPDFENTIFIITGDHRLIPIPQPSQIARYHVPLLLYSPLLHKSQRFRSVSTLADVAPTLFGFLRAQYGVAVLKRSHWLGTPIDTTRRFRSTRSMPLMRNKNQLVDYLHKGYYLANDQLYRVQEDLRLAPVSNAKKQRALRGRLSRFKTINQYVTQEDRLYSPTVSLEELPSTTPLRAATSALPAGPTPTAIDSVLSAIRRQDLTPPEQFQMARQKAFDGQYELARAVAKRLLEDHPDYHDVRLLLGRTYAWSRAFDRARRAFREVLRRDSTYHDAYNALADTELWAARPETALEVTSEGLTHHPDRPGILAKKAKALLALQRTAEAKTVVSKLERVAPHNDALPTLTERLNP